MAIFRNIFIRHLKFNKLFFSSIQACHIHDRYFDYFRNNDPYKNALVQFNANSRENKLANFEFPFSKEKKIKEDDFFSHLLIRENVMKLSKIQLKDAMCLLANTKLDPQKYENALQFLDEKCAMSVDRWPLDLSLYVLDAWFIIYGPKTFRKHYYFALTNLLSKKMKRCSKHNLMIVLYFIGLSKKSPPYIMELLTYKLEKFISDLSDEEWAIACLSFFKTSTKVNSDLILEKCCKVAENLMIKKDHFNLISILKCLRLSEYFNDNLMNVLDAYVKREYTSFNFVECTNFLATFATQNVYNFETYCYLENHGISLLSKEHQVTEFDRNIEKLHPSERSRVKDLARFLWGMAFVGHDINQKSIDFLLKTLSARLNSGEFEYNIPTLVDCVQSFILFGYYPLNMIEYVLRPASIETISNNYKSKPRYQVYFINRSAYIENYVTKIKINGFKSIPKSLQKEVFERKGYQELLDYLDFHLKENNFTCCFIMSHIMISGIVVATNLKENNCNKPITSTLIKLIEDGVISKSIQDILQDDKMYTCIELLDPSVCVHGNTMPLGLMKAKIHQLQELNFNVLTITSDEINALKSGHCQKLQDILL